ncbi:MAG: recombinase family protein [Verrucomicrobiales bacterium]|nr:recombinase family protein [Verrucomicrobiales bacterium]
MLVGYARVSTSDQDTGPQIDALREAGVEKIFKENASGGRWDRPELHRMLEMLREGDQVVVWKLDRLSRSLLDLLQVIRTFDEEGIGFRSVTENVNTTTPAGRMLLQMVGAFAEFERSMIRERTKAGLEAAKARGAAIGRPKALTEDQIKEATKMIQSGDKSKADVARLFQVHPSTISRLVPTKLLSE